MPVSRITREHDLFSQGMGAGLENAGLGVAHKIADMSRGRQWVVPGSHGQTYTVRHHNVDGGWTCTCPAFGYGRGVECKHIVKVRAEESADAIGQPSSTDQ